MSILHYQTDGYTAFVSLENSVSAQSLIIHSSKDNLSKMLFFRAGNSTTAPEINRGSSLPVRDLFEALLIGNGIPEGSCKIAALKYDIKEAIVVRYHLR